MSTADDVAEMQTLCGFIADRLAEESNDKSRVSAICSALGGRITWNRAFEFLKAKARRVDSWEKDLARQQVEKIKRAERERAVRRHTQWLRSTLQHAVDGGADVDRADLAVVERVLARVGALDSSLGSAATAAERTNGEG